LHSDSGENFLRLFFEGRQDLGGEAAFVTGSRHANVGANRADGEILNRAREILVFCRDQQAIQNVRIMVRNPER
jgi:hypothetical protein